MNSDTFYIDPSGHGYPVDDIEVRSYDAVFAREDKNGTKSKTFHKAFAIYRISTNECVDNFCGAGFGTEEEAERSVFSNTIWSPKTSEDTITKNSDSTSYQDIEFPDNPDTFDKNEMETLNKNLALSELEYFRLFVFNNNHSECGKGKDVGAIGIGNQIKLSFNSIGRSVTVQCPFCGKVANLTDYSKW